MSKSDEIAFGGSAVFLIVVLVLLVIAGGMFGMPYYWVFHQHLAGQAALAKTQYTKQTLVQEAQAKEEAAKFLADAEIARARGVAEANKIIGDSLKGNDAYLHYLWLHNLETGDHDVIYIPTEAGLPIFEAGGRYHRRGAGDPPPPPEAAPD